MTTSEAMEIFETSKSDMRKASEQIGHYNRSSALELWDVYGACSVNKRRAFNFCKELCEALSGHDLKIISHNLQAFTVGFMFTHPTTGADCFAYITRDYNRFCEV